MIIRNIAYRTPLAVGFLIGSSFTMVNLMLLVRGAGGSPCGPHSLAVRLGARRACTQRQPRTARRTWSAATAVERRLERSRAAHLSGETTPCVRATSPSHPRPLPLLPPPPRHSQTAVISGAQGSASGLQAVTAFASLLLICLGFFTCAWLAHGPGDARAGSALQCAPARALGGDSCAAPACCARPPPVRQPKHTSLFGFATPRPSSRECSFCHRLARHAAAAAVHVRPERRRQLGSAAAAVRRQRQCVPRPLPPPTGARVGRTARQRRAWLARGWRVVRVGALGYPAHACLFPSLPTSPIPDYGNYGEGSQAYGGATATTDQTPMAPAVPAAGGVL
jgi:hypothetical protein